MFEEFGSQESENKDAFEVSLDDVAETKEITPGTYTLEITKAKKSSSKEGTSILTVDYVITEGPEKGVHAKDRFDLSRDWDRERLKKFTVGFAVAKNAAGKYDLSEGALLGRTGTAWLKWDAFFDTNRPARYVRPGTGQADAGPVLR